ncbi:DnaA/Hda family protein [Nocardiopsis valliformis]|uniref:ATP-binding protein n=1 Tax=Nocardiopsis valliformis TaxID=239974 RepID=UPI00034C04CE|nr:ATP-binding protein [Nocardiopsis valliformis]
MSTLTLPLGAGPDGETVHWHLSDENGRPRHGVIVGPAGSGGTTALQQLCRAAAAADLYPLAVDPHHGLADPGWWNRTWPSQWWTTPQDLTEGLRWAETADGAGEPHLVLLVDGNQALTADPGGWQRLLAGAHRAQASVVVRATTLESRCLAGTAVRQALLGQYLALGSIEDPLARSLLEGYTFPDGRTRPGSGVYGHAGTTTPVSVPNLD